MIWLWLLFIVFLRTCATAMEKKKKNVKSGVMRVRKSVFVLIGFIISQPEEVISVNMYVFYLQNIYWTLNICCIYQLSGTCINWFLHWIIHVTAAPWKSTSNNSLFIFISSSVRAISVDNLSTECLNNRRPVMQNTLCGQMEEKSLEKFKR